MMRFCSRSLFLDFCPCGDIHEKRVRKRRKMRNLVENRLYPLSDWFLWQRSEGHFCRTGMDTLSSCSVNCVTLSGIENLAFPYGQFRQFWALLAIHGSFPLK